MLRGECREDGVVGEDLPADSAGQADDAGVVAQRVCSQHQMTGQDRQRSSGDEFADSGEEMFAADHMLAPAGRVFRAWRAQLESLLQSSGVPAEHAPGLAALVLASCEGAVVIARAEHSLEPLDLIETILIAAAQATMPVAD